MRKDLSKREPDALTLLQTIVAGYGQVIQSAKEGYDAELEINIEF